MKTNEISINISGDFYSNAISDAENYFSEELLERFYESDFNIINLESPVTNSIKNRILKTGPYLPGSPYTFFYLKQLRTHLVTLATNHIMDYGPHGLSDTLLGCRENSINYVGAGMSLAEAKKPCVLEKNNTKIAVLNFAENEWASASENKPGANPMNIPENVRQIRVAKEANDFVLVIIHGGHELYHLPSPRMVSQYRFYAENGASAIIGHHTHCISGFEIYQGIPIFYSLGNFLFTKKYDYESWYSGLILNLKIKKHAKLEWELLAKRQDKDTHTLTILNGIAKQNVMDAIDQYSEIISNQKLLMENWEYLVDQKYNYKLELFSPVNVLGNKKIRQLLRKAGLSRYFRRKMHYAEILNELRCESHSDVLKSVITRFLEKR